MERPLHRVLACPHLPSPHLTSCTYEPEHFPDMCCDPAGQLHACRHDTAYSGPPSSTLPPPYSTMPSNFIVILPVMLAQAYFFRPRPIALPSSSQRPVGVCAAGAPEAGRSHRHSDQPSAKQAATEALTQARAAATALSSLCELLLASMQAPGAPGGAALTPSNAAALVSVASSVHIGTAGGGLSLLPVQVQADRLLLQLLAPRNMLPMVAGALHAVTLQLGRAKELRPPAGET